MPEDEAKQVCISVNIDAGHIDECIAKAVVESKLGEAVAHHIEEFLGKETSYGKVSLQKEIERSIDTLLRDIVMDIIRTEYKDKVEEAIRERLTDDVMNSVTYSMMDSWLNKHC